MLLHVNRVLRRQIALLTAAFGLALLLSWVRPADLTARPVVQLRGLAYPRGIAVDPQGSPFVSAGNQVLQVVARGLAVPLGAPGGQPAGLAFDAAGTLYVADRMQKAVLQVNSSGDPRVFAARCGGAPFQQPERIAAGANGDLFVTDARAARVCRVDPQGGASVFAAGLKRPLGIAVAADTGQVFVGDGPRIWRFAPDGGSRALFAQFSGDAPAAGLAFDHQGNLYAARDGAGEISVLNSQGQAVAAYPLPGRRVSDLAFGGADLRNLYAAELESGSLFRLRTPSRSQRLPWEPRESLSISEPVDGAILNRHDGETTPAGLRISLRGFCRAAGVRVNGASVPVENGAFQTTLVLRERETRIVAEAADGARKEITVLWDRNSFPRYRVSTDDNILFFKDLALHAGSYHSLFDNPYLAFWREMHRKYGAKVHFNIYYETPGFNLSQMPARFRPEWQANADWIHLTIHARANDPDRPYLHASPEQVREDYRLVTREIERFAGKELLSPITTVHWGALTREAARALRAEGVRGLVGYFEARDGLPSVCYYLPLAQWRYLSGRDYWKDTREDLLFLRHDMVVNLFPLEQIVPRLEQVAADPHQAEILELMIHEQYFYPDYRAYEPDYRQRVERAIQWVTRHGYRPVFYSDGFLGAPDRP
ncbi:MAG TPA: SMP-30/gluconolactonase/LRE family protein [Bryobacteraceae bacterium]|nr:SMP-30/gluconolactonase/LRE family protein [Bryobacteraceae bacterium]